MLWWPAVWVIFAPHFDQDRGYDHPRNSNQGKPGRDFRGDDDDDRMQNNRRMREERGVQRLQQDKWQTGYVMPQRLPRRRI